MPQVNSSMFSGCGSFVFTASASKIIMWRVDGGETVFVHPTHGEPITQLSVSASPYGALSRAGGRAPLAFGTALGRVFVAHVTFPSSLSEEKRGEAAGEAAGGESSSASASDVRRPSLNYEQTQKLLGKA